MFDAKTLIDTLVNQDHLPTRIVKILKEKQFKNELNFIVFMKNY